jgi:hypothetical protein
MCHTLHHPAEVAFNIEHYLCECICVLCVAALYFHNLFQTFLEFFRIFVFEKLLKTPVYLIVLTNFSHHRVGEILILVQEYFLLYSQQRQCLPT